MKLVTIFLTFLIYLTSLISCSFKEQIVNNKQEIAKVNDNSVISLKKNQIFHDNIKTVICQKKNKRNSVPIINLNSDDKLTIKFDALETIKKDYYYTITLCNEDWTINNLNKNEYLYGFINNQITDYEFSFNTKQEYIHYQFEFPSENIYPKLSGNYIFEIYDENNELAFTERFMVLDTKVLVEAKVRRATLAKYKNTKHEIDINLKHNDIDINDPFSDVKIHIKQNNHDINSITNLEPLFIKNNELIYDFEEENLFWGNNEYRYFDIRSLRFLSEEINNIQLVDDKYVVFLQNDFERTFENYSIMPDINGDFIIEVQEGWDSSVECDYAKVKFSLSMDKVGFGDLYLIGAFSDWEISEKFKLIYNQKKHKYEQSVILKQGFYNYQYALYDSTNNTIDLSFTEGSHYQTKNEYFIYVYLKDHMNSYDRLIGFSKKDSNDLF